jgi:predicted MFS family arabinose efflux permease
MNASRGYVLTVLFALAAVNHLDRQLMAILLEPVRTEFQLSDTELGLLSGIAFVALFSILSIPAAIWAATHNRRNLIAAAAILWGAMTLCCGLAHSFAQLFLARLGVGVGEAGGVPPSQAIVSDLYRPGERATAQAVLLSGINAGVFVAFLIGGYLGQRYGWRTAFVCAGVLTVLLAILLRLTVAEPARVDDPTQRAQRWRSRSLLFETVRAMWRDPVLRHVWIGATLTATVGAGALAWAPSYLVRVHGMGLAAVGSYLAVVIGIGGLVGTWIVGAWSDRMRRRDVRWSLWLIAALFIASKPLSIGFYVSDVTWVALLLFLLPAIVGSSFLGPSVATLHDRIDPHLRPVASAMLAWTMNLIGIGIGPLVVGMTSDLLHAAYGPASLRYALVALQIAGIWGVLHFYWAGRRLARGDEDSVLAG